LIDQMGKLDTWELEQEQKEQEIRARLLEESELKNIEGEVLERCMGKG
jgi:hypothetical protein